MNYSKPTILEIYNTTLDVVYMIIKKMYQVYLQCFFFFLNHLARNNMEFVIPCISTFLNNLLTIINTTLI